MTGIVQPAFRPIKQVGLIDLLSLVILIIPVSSAISVVRHSGGGILRYLTSGTMGLLLSFLITWASWKLGKSLFIRAKERSERLRNVIGFALFAFQLFWIFVGLVGGVKVGSLVVDHIAR